MPWSPKGTAYASKDMGETSSKIARNLLLATPAERLRRNQAGGFGSSHSIDNTFSVSPMKDGKVTLAKIKPYRKVYQDFPVAVSDPNRMRDMGTDFGTSLAGNNKYAYRLLSPDVSSKRLRSSLGSLQKYESEQKRGSINKSNFWSNVTKRSRGFNSVHALDGLTQYYPTRDLTKVYARPL